MKYCAIRDLEVLAECETPSGRWVVSDGILLWKEGDNIKARRGYLVDFPSDDSDPIWTDYYPLDEGGNLNLDLDSDIRVGIVTNADLQRLLPQDVTWRTVHETDQIQLDADDVDTQRLLTELYCLVDELARLVDPDGDGADDVEH